MVQFRIDKNTITTNFLFKNNISEKSGSMRRYCIFVCTLLLTTLIISKTSLAQGPKPQYIIHGIINDYNGEPIENNTVIITNLNTGEAILTKTNDEGKYQENLAELNESWDEDDEILINSSYKQNTGRRTFFPNGAGKQVDITIPFIKIEDISGNSIVSKVVGIEIVVNKTIEINNVDYFINNTVENSSKSTKWTWNTLNIKNGHYTIKIVVNGSSDDTNDTYEARIKVQVENSENRGNNKKWFSFKLAVFICLILIILILTGLSYKFKKNTISSKQIPKRNRKSKKR